MNTIAIPTGFTETRTSARSLFASTGFVIAPGRPPADWLPAPPYTGSLSPGKQVGRSNRSDRGLWAQLQSQSELEVLGFGLLALAAFLGIAYGFSCMVHLVQHWALFDLGVGHLIQ